MSKQTTYNDAMAVGFAGQLLAGSPVAMINNEASAEMPFGVAVAFEGGSDDKGALLPDSISVDVIAGILVHTHSYHKPEQLGDSGVKPGQMLNVLRRGRLLAVCEDGCTPGARLHVRAVAGGGEQEGALLASPDGTDTIDCGNQGVWLTTASAGGLAELEVDFTAAPLDTY